MKNTAQGFTLIELLIVIAIIGILAAVLIPNLLGARKRAYDTAATSCAKSFQTVQAIIQVDHQTYVDIGSGMAGVVPKVNLTSDGLNMACSNSTVLYVMNTSASGTTYAYTFWDTRGRNAYKVTPEGIQTVAVPNSGGANIPAN